MAAADPQSSGERMSGYLIDTNILSEPLSKYPNAGAIKWLASVERESQYISVITLMEIHKGILGTRDSSKRIRREKWAEELPVLFGKRLLDVDMPVALKLAGILNHAPKTPPAYDAIIAATASAHGLIVVTHNVNFRAIPDIKVLDPWG